VLYIRKFFLEEFLSTIEVSLFRMLLTRAVRPDRLIIAAKSFVGSVFGPEFVQKADALLNFEQIINEEVRDVFLD
jgi:hypothetical protein